MSERFREALVRHAAISGEGSAAHRLSRFAVPLAADAFAGLRSACVTVIAALERLVYDEWQGSARTVSRAIPLEGDEDWIAFLLESARCGAGCSRCDAVQTRDGWRVLEANIGNAGGWDIASCADAFVADGISVSAGDTAGIFFAHLDDLAHSASRAPSRPVIAMIGGQRCSWPSQTGTERRMKSAVISTTWDRLAFTDDGSWLGDTRINLILELDIVDCPQRMRAAYCASEGHVVLLPGPFSQLANDKRLLAALSERREVDRASTHIPWTRAVRQGPSYKGAQARDLPALILARRESLVLKRSLSDGGRHVFAGRACDEAEWTKLTDRALEEGDWIVQEWAEPVTLEDPEGHASCGIHLVWGGFVIDGCFAGAFARVLRADGYGRAVGSKPMSLTVNGDENITLFPGFVARAPDKRPATLWRKRHA